MLEYSPIISTSSTVDSGWEASPVMERILKHNLWSYLEDRNAPVFLKLIRRTTDGQINERPKKVEEFGVYLRYRGSKIPLGGKRLADGVLTPPFYDRIIPHAYEGYEDPSFVFALLSLVGLAFYDFTSTL
jgi:hypothetical protein